MAKVVLTLRAHLDRVQKARPYASELGQGEGP